jgi:hypothetical protein
MKLCVLVVVLALLAVSAHAGYKSELRAKASSNPLESQVRSFRGLCDIPTLAVAKGWCPAIPCQSTDRPNLTDATRDILFMDVIRVVSSLCTRCIKTATW